MSRPVYLLTGESFLAEEALEKVRAETGADPLGEAVFDSDAETHELIGALSTASLLGGRRLVIVRDAQDLKKDQVEALTRYLESPSPDSVLVLVSTGRTKLDVLAKGKGAVLALDAPKGRRLLEWLKTRAKVHRLLLDDRAGWALIDAVGTGLRDLDGALSQLLTALGPGTRVGPAEIRRAFPRLADERIFVFTDAVGDRRLAPAMATLRRLLEQGEEPLVLLGALTAHVRRLIRARREAERGSAAVADALGLPAWRAERLTKQARAFREDELADAIGVLASCDVEMKGGDVPPEAALEQAVVQIIGAPSPSAR